MENKIIPTFQQIPQTVRTLPGFIALLKEAFALYKQKIGTLALVLLPVSLVVGLFVGLYAYLLSSNPGKLPEANAMIVIPAALAAFIIFVATSLAYTYVLSKNERVGAMVALKRAFISLDIFGLWWLSFVMGVIIMGGFGLFIVPGIVFMVWFYFSLPIFFNENIRGISAMLKSKEYVRGVWWKVFGRIVSLMAVTLVLSFGLQYILGMAIKGLWLNLATSLISYLVITPIVMSYILVLYNKVREAKGEIAFNAPIGKRVGLFVLGITGMFIGSFVVGMSAPFILDRVNSLQTATVAWKEYQSADKSFSVLLPSSNVTIKESQFVSGIGTNIAFIVQSKEYPLPPQTGDEDSDLLNFSQGLSPQLAGFDGHRAVDFGGDTRLGVYIKGRAIIANGRFYGLSMIYKNESDFNEAIYRRFIDSFKLSPVVVLQDDSQSDQTLKTYHGVSYQISYPEFIRLEDAYGKVFHIPDNYFPDTNFQNGFLAILSGVSCPDGGDEAVINGITFRKSYISNLAVDRSGDYRETYVTTRGGVCYQIELVVGVRAMSPELTELRSEKPFEILRGILNTFKFTD